MFVFKLYGLVVIYIVIFILFEIFLIICFENNINKSLTVLVYHQIEDPVKSDVSCTPTQFEEHIKVLLNSNIKFINLDDLYKIIIGERRYFEKFENLVLVSFDDGYESLYDYALPIATKYQVPMVVFMITSRFGMKPQNIRYLSEEQVKIMSESGLFEFGSHTHNFHTNLLTIFKSFKPLPTKSFEQVLEYDLVLSKNNLDCITNKRCFTIAWPYGKYNKEIQKIAVYSGYKLLFTSIFGKNYNIIDPFSIKRIPVSRRDTPQQILKKVKRNLILR